MLSQLAGAVASATVEIIAQMIMLRFDMGGKPSVLMKQ
jgi:hypothetical protein